VHTPINLKQIRLCGWYPGGTIFTPQLIELAKGDACTHEHLEPNWQNRMVLSEYLGKMIVHVRDPRMATLEWVYFLNQLEPKMNPDFKLSGKNKNSIYVYEDTNEPGFEEWMMKIFEDPR